MMKFNAGARGGVDRIKEKLGVAGYIHEEV